MNTHQAKALSLVDVLAQLGFAPHHSKGQDSWYISPLREEKTPSFKVDRGRNIWFDFALGKGGTVIDLFMQLYDEPHIPRVLDLIGSMGTIPVSQVSQTVPQGETRSPTIKRVTELESRSLSSYLVKRGLNVERAKTFLSEVHYQVGDKTYFGLGYANSEQGFELKNPYFKGTIGKKAMSVICGERSDQRIAIFEGMFDFLSLLELHNKAQAPYDCIIMNSVALTPSVAEYIQANGYPEVHSYLDNDPAGRTAVSDFRRLLPTHTLHDHSPSYADYKDINEYLIHRQQLKIDLDAQQPKL